MPGAPVRRLISLVLLVLAVGMGPGLALVEAVAHPGAGWLGHGFRDHFEAQDAQDHSDECAVGVAASLARGSLAPSPIFRLPRRIVARYHLPATAEHPPAPTLLPPSRAPPSQA